MSQVQTINFLDPTFGEGGRFTYHFNSGELHEFSNTNISRQLDGKIIVSRRLRVSPSVVSQALIQCLADGTVDSSFATNGEWFTVNPWFSQINKLLVQPDGKIVIAGRQANEATFLRLLPDSSYDTDFGENGIIKHAVYALPTTIGLADIKLLSDGKLVFSTSVVGNKDVAMFCLNSDGHLSPEFGTMSKVLLTAGQFGYQFITGLRIAITADDKILAAGSLSNLQNQWSLGFVRRYDSTGKIDSTFGQNGTTLFESKSVVGDIQLFPDGRFVIACVKSINFSDELAHAKFNANGIIDATYGINGYAFFIDDGCYLRSTFLQPDGKVIFTTFCITGPDGYRSVATRYHQNGTVDATFGDNGRIGSSEYLGGEYNYAGLQFEQGFALSNEKFIVSGTAHWGDTLVVARYLTSQSVGVVDAPSTIHAAFLYPNPVSTLSVNLEYELPENDIIEIQLINAAGEWMTTLLKAPRALGKNNEILILPAGLNSGSYYLNVRNNHGNTFVKLVVIRG